MFISCPRDFVKWFTPGSFIRTKEPVAAIFLGTQPVGRVNFTTVGSQRHDSDGHVRPRCSEAGHGTVIGPLSDKMALEFERS